MPLTIDPFFIPATGLSDISTDISSINSLVVGNSLLVNGTAQFSQFNRGIVQSQTNGTLFSSNTINNDTTFNGNLTIGNITFRPSNYEIQTDVGFIFRYTGNTPGYSYEILNAPVLLTANTSLTVDSANIILIDNQLTPARLDINPNGIFPRATFNLSAINPIDFNINGFTLANISSNIKLNNLTPNRPMLLNNNGIIITGNIPAQFISNIGDDFVSKGGDTMTGGLTLPSLDVKANSQQPNPFDGYILLRPNIGGNNVIYGDGNRPFYIEGQTALNEFHIDGFSSINLDNPTVIKNFLNTDYIDARTNFMDIGSSASTINFGGPSATLNFQGNIINFFGNTTYSNVTNHSIADKDIQLNANSVGSGTCRGAGLLFRDAGIDFKGYFITSTTDGRGFWFVAPEQTHSLITELRVNNFTGGIFDYPLLQSHYDGSTTKIEPSVIQVANITTLETNVLTLQGNITSINSNINTLFANASTQQAEILNRVIKTGDTMTGTLEMNNASISVKKNTSLPPFGGYIQLTPNVSGNNKIYNDGAGLDIDGQTNNNNLNIKNFQTFNIENPTVCSNLTVGLLNSLNTSTIVGTSGLNFLNNNWRITGNTQIGGTLTLNGSNPRISGNITGALIMDASNIFLPSLTASRPLSLDASNEIISGNLSQSVITNLTTDLNGKLPLAGGTMSGSIAMSQQIISNCIQVGTDDLITAISGIITLSSNLKGDPGVFYECAELPTINAHLTNKNYVDDEINTSFSNVLAGNHSFTGLNTFTKDTTLEQNLITGNIQPISNDIFVNGNTVICPKNKSPCIILYPDETTPSNANPTYVSQDGFTVSQLKNGTANQGVYLQSWNSRDLILNSLGNNVQIGKAGTGISLNHYGGSATFYNNANTGQYYQLNYNTHFTDGTNIAIDGQSSNYSYSIRNYNAYNVGAAWTVTSDKREKRNITYINPIDAVQIIRGLKPCRFKYRNDHSKTHIGFIAQDVDDVLPIAVSEIEYDEKDDDDDTIEKDGLRRSKDKPKKTRRIKSLDYNSIFSYQTSVIQYLLEENQKLKQRLEHIEKRLF